MSIVIATIFVACNPDEPEVPEVPDGMVVLTEDNFHQYFTINVDTKVYYDLVDEVNYAVATSYVSIVAKFDYVEVQGEVKYLLGTRVRDTISLMSQPIVSGKQTLILDSCDYVNDSFSVKKRPSNASDFYEIEETSKDLILTDVSGYLYVGDNYTPHAYEKLTKSDFDNSALVQLEFESKLAEIVMDIATGELKTCQYTEDFSCQLNSMYGGNRDVDVQTERTFDVDFANYSLKEGDEIYYYNVEKGAVMQQYKNIFGLVEENIVAMTQNELLASMLPPVLAAIDDNAVFVRGEGESYYAYNTLENMSTDESYVYKELFVSILEPYGCTEDYDKYYVTAYFSFNNGVEFSIKIEHFDIFSQGEYKEQIIDYKTSMAKINEVKIDVLTPENSVFALERTKEEVMLEKTGLVDIDTSTTQIELTLCSCLTIEEAGYYSQNNWMPIKITEAGYYTFDCKDKYGYNISLYIYDSNGNYFGEDGYFEVGIYYVKYNSIDEYALTEAVLNVKSYSND